jgi:hypothetical protein
MSIFLPYTTFVTKFAEAASTEYRRWYPDRGQPNRHVCNGTGQAGGNWYIHVNSAHWPWQSYVLNVVHINPSTGVRRVVCEAGLTWSAVWHTLQEWQLYSFHVLLAQRLQPVY